uniref:Uncharacterized protein n=1 Tax=Lotharella oceanica TaxID=641309 RepID=A0A7S2X8X7_9EUKA|mmetsp:Transcript_2089/g.4004  ORF Transcript_2089/g.4004 Transcript_2089/m.4004 type:complete len:133 (+) Transcript_2089:490-888(+)
MDGRQFFLQRTVPIHQPCTNIVHNHAAMCIFQVALVASWKFEIDNVNGEEVCIVTSLRKNSAGFIIFSVIFLICVIFDMGIFIESTIGLTTPICSSTAKTSLKLESAKHSIGGFMSGLLAALFCDLLCLERE